MTQPWSLGRLQGSVRRPERHSSEPTCPQESGELILRKSAPISKEYGVGDLVCFRTDQLGWSTVSRIIGFDGPKVVWVLCKGNVSLCST